MMAEKEMYVIKRNGRKEQVAIEKITSRIRHLCYGLDMDALNPFAITLKTVGGIYTGITTVELDNLAAEIAASLTSRHQDYAILAARIAVSNLHKETKKNFSEVVKQLYEVYDKNGKHFPRVSKELYELSLTHAQAIDSKIIHKRDYEYDYFGIKTLMCSYLLKVDDKIVERPQQMLMRVALGIHGSDLNAAFHTYELMSNRMFTHASPTLFNSGTPRPQMSSCFVLTMRDDSIKGIMETFTDCAFISKWAGGIGLNIHNIRAKGTAIRGTGGVSMGIVPMLRLFNEEARYVNQGGKRPGAFAIYLEPWHADIFEFVQLRKNVGKEEMRTRDLFLGLWVPDLFMERVECDGQWSLMCPHLSPGLAECYGEEFNELYTKYETEGNYVRQVKARELWFAIIDAQMETGTPYMLYKDHCNRKTNQKNLGVIRCSNLCTEIIEYTAPNEVAVCNLASIALNKFVDPETKKFDFMQLKEVTKTVTNNLNKIIDLSFYPIEEARYSNRRNRPMGIGVQGLADTFFLMRYPFDSDEAKDLNIKIFETIYYGALEASCEQAEKLGAYETYKGSPASMGLLQYDLWDRTPTDLWDWAALKAKIAEHGIRNSLLLAPMPTASTAQILGNYESIEPCTNNIYTRRVLSGEFQVVNKYLLRDLQLLGIWDERMRQEIIYNRGSIQSIDRVPEDLKKLYRTVWEIPQKELLQMAADRGAFIDQSQSLNIFFEVPTRSKMTSLHFHSWKLGLKTGMYYLRTKPAAHAIQFTVDKSKFMSTPNKSDTKSESLTNGANGEATDEEIAACSRENPDACTLCSA